MKAPIAALLAGLVIATAHPVPTQGQDLGGMHVLVLTGEDNAHDWDTNSNQIIDAWRAWGLTNVERQAMTTEADWEAWDGDYADYDAVVHMYYTAGAPDGPIQALADYVAGGGALVVVHSGLAGLQGHAAFDELIGVGWRDADYGSSVALDGAGERTIRAPGDGRGAQHPRRHDFPVRTIDPDHPITSGLPAVWMQPDDELYFNLRGPVGEMHILAVAPAPDDTFAPMLWTREIGEGRVFVTTIGHAGPSIDSVGFITTLIRGLEWTVTGDVTTRVPTNFPGPDAPVVDAPEFGASPG